MCLMIAPMLAERHQVAAPVCLTAIHQESTSLERKGRLALADGPPPRAIHQPPEAALHPADRCGGRVCGLRHRAWHQQCAKVVVIRAQAPAGAPLQWNFGDVSCLAPSGKSPNDNHATLREERPAAAWRGDADGAGHDGASCRTQKSRTLRRVVPCVRPKSDPDDRLSALRACDPTRPKAKRPWLPSQPDDPSAGHSS